jgi:hypothetical protein
MYQQTERDELLSCISDFHKDLYGCRPSLERFINLPIADLKVYFTSLAQDLEAELRNEAEEARYAVGPAVDHPVEESFPRQGLGWCFTPAA